MSPVILSERERTLLGNAIGEACYDPWWRNHQIASEYVRLFGVTRDQLEAIRHELDNRRNIASFLEVNALRKLLIELAYVWHDDPEYDTRTGFVVGDIYPIVLSLDLWLEQFAADEQKE